MGQFIRGETFIDGENVTGTRLNALVDAATPDPSLISGKPATAPAVGDKVLLYDASGVALIAPTLTDVLALQLADTAAGTASMRTLGYTGNKAAPGVSAAGTANDNTFTGTNQFTRIAGTYGGQLAIATGAGLGTGGSPSAAFATNSTNLYGRILLVSGSTGGTGVVATVTFDSPAFSAAPFVVMVSYNAAAITNQGASGRITVAATTTGFTLNNTSFLQLSSTMHFNYIVLGK